MRVITVGTLIRQHTPNQRQTANLKIMLKRIELARLLKIKARIDISTGRLDHQSQIGLAARIEERQVKATGIPIGLELRRRLLPKLLAQLIDQALIIPTVRIDLHAH